MNSASRAFSLGLTLCLAFAGCKAGDPNSAAYQLKRLSSSKHLKEKIDALQRLRKIGDKSVVPELLPFLKEPGDVKVETAVLLGELKEKQAVPALVDAIDFSVGAGADKSTSEANKANKEIARALGLLGDPAALQPLIKLLKSKDNYVKLEAIASLGKLKDPSAVAPLSELATDESAETLVNKKAIMALGDVGDPTAIPAITKMLFRERKGVSFFAESSFALYEVGPQSADGLLKVLKGEDKELLAWAEEHNVIDAALVAKAAQILGDLQEKRAIEPLLKQLAFNSDYLDIKLMVRMQAADALGRIRAQKAVGVLAGMLGEEEANTRMSYARALVMIGDRAAIPALSRAAEKGSWDAREVCISALSKLGDERELKLFDELAGKEKGRTDAECKENEIPAEDCKKSLEGHLKIIEQHKARLVAAKECKDAGCWAGKLKDANAAVRERAAYDLGRQGAAPALPQLFEAIQRPAESVADLDARFAAICACDWITGSHPEQIEKMRGNADALDALIEKEAGKTMTVKIDEEVKRLVVKLRRKVSA